MTVKTRPLHLIACAAALFGTASAADSQIGRQPTAGVVPAAPSIGYADLADLALSAPVAAHVRIHRASVLRPNEAPGLRPGISRLYVEADVIALVRGPAGLPTRVAYLVDLPNQPNGRPAKLDRRTEALVLASAVPGRPGELRLVAPDAQLPFAPATADRLRAILREASARDAAPRISGIGRAFHVPGALPGESETQLFLQTQTGRPISLSVLRRPGEQPRWSVALGEIVDEAAAAPLPDTLLWYRLACGLPRQLPTASLEGDTDNAAAVRRDYQFVLQSLGPCGRMRTRG